MKWHEANQEVTIAGNTDMYAYAGPIDKSGYASICEVLEANKARRANALLILCTNGGDANAGYRIARALTHHYGSDNFRVAAPAECKSAGTLICIGASSLVVFDRGELGPLDVQFQKKDEIFQQSSGLDILRGMTYIKSDALSAFNEYMLSINGGSGLSTKVASEIASNLVNGMYSPMYAQIDPIRLGEMNAALQVAHEYGTRLNAKSKNLKVGALKKLINDYPTHGFVIDRAEARELFEKVVGPTDAERVFGDFVKEAMWKTGRRTSPHVMNLTEFVQSVLEPKNEPIPVVPASEPQGADGAASAGQQAAAGPASAGNGTE